MAARLNDFGQPVGSPVGAALPSGPPSADTIVGERCTVEALCAPSHRAALFEAFDAAPDDRSWTYLPIGPFADEPAFARWLEGHAASNDQICFAIRDEQGPCGMASYMRISPLTGSVEIGGIHFAPRLVRTRAATEAMFLLMQRVFESGYRRCEWKCDALNAASRVAAQRLGFTFEGVFRQALVYKGRNRDTAWFSMIDAEWPAIRAEFQRWLSPDNFDDHDVQRTSLRASGSPGDIATT